MFDITNDENRDKLRGLIDDRDDNCFVIPLFVLSNHKKYGLWELDQITDFSINTFRVGFGSSMGLFVKSPFPKEYMFAFDMEIHFNYFDYEENTERRYFVFESGMMSDEEANQSVMHQQMKQYIDALAEYVSKHVEEYRNTIRQSMLNDDDSYL